MEVIKGDLRGRKGIPRNGLCLGVHRAGTMHKRLAAKSDQPLTVWSLRPDIEFLAYQRDDLAKTGIRATGDIEDAVKDVIFGVRGAPPQVREKAAEMGLEVLADATCPYVVEQEAAAEELLKQGLNLVMLSDPNHHGIPRIRGIAEKLGRSFFIVESAGEVAKINLTRQEPIGVIVQTTFWMETYKEIMAAILERFANVQVRNTACIDSLQRLPVVAELARETDGIVIVGWTEGMTNRMVETARACSDHVFRVEGPDEIEAAWFEGLKKVGVIGANETPDWMVDEAIARIKGFAAA